MFNWRVLHKSTAFLLWSLAGLLVGAFVYGTIDKTVIVSEEMMVIPGVATSDVWSGVAETLISDLNEHALYQNFTTGNAAFIDAEYVRSLELGHSIPATSNETGTTEDLNVSDGIVGGESQDSLTNDTTLNDVSPDVSVVEGEAQEEETTTPNEDATDSETSFGTGNLEGEASGSGDEEVSPAFDPEPVQEEGSSNGDSSPESETPSAPAPEASGETVSWGFPVSRSLFPLVQAVITDYVTTSEDVLVGSEPVPEEESVNVELSESSFTVDGEEALDSGNESENEVTVGEEGVFTESEDVLEGADSLLPTEEVVDPLPRTDGVEDSGAANEGVDGLEEEVLVEEEPEEVFSPLDACVGYEDCMLYPVTFSGFVVPEFESGKFLSNVELRLSLGAQAKTDSGPQQFVVEYRYEVDGTWRVATIIDIEDEVSNSLNGGYYLVALDKPLSQAQISALEVRVSYLGSIESLTRAYIEAVWLEITSSSFYEESDPYYNKDSIVYDRDLLLPAMHELTSQDFDISIEDLPSFTLSYSPQENFLRRVATAIFSENTYEVETVRLLDSHGDVLDVPFDVVYRDEKVWTIEFKKQPQKLVPGKYRLEIVVNENDTRYVDALEFYWGVLAVNTTKGRYFSGEEVTFNLAALTDKGDTICDAILELKVIDPEGVISEVPVEQGGACAKNNVTDVPDYLAAFSKTGVYGRYTIQLRHLNQDGEVVHKIEDHFTVEEYIPFVIERTAPTRIYPPAPYDVTVKVSANRTYTGDIVEEVPRGFVITEAGDAEIETLPGFTRIIWKNVNLNEGDEIELSYKFDAPDISPYLYLLGPLTLDTYKELRPWQIASDAITAVGWLTGTRTVAGTNLNQAPSPLQWSTSSLDTFYYTHSTSSNTHELTIRQDGDYFLAVNVPHQRTDANARSTRIGLEVRVNGVAVPQGRGRSGYISNQSGQNESSSHVFIMLDDLAIDDVVTVYAEGLTTINAADIVNVTGAASMYLEYLSNDVGVFAATTTRTTNSTNLNQTTEYAFQWIETRQDTGFVHSDSVNSEQIVLSSAGIYHVQASIPLNSDSNNTNVLGQIRLDGALVSGGQFKQGYGQAPGTESDPDSSIHFSGIVVATTTNQVLTLTAQREGNAGTVVVPTGLVGSVFIRKLPTSELLALRGTALVGGTNWNPAAAAAVQWSLQDAKDATIFTHSTSTNSHQITITSNGDYYFSYNDALTNGVTRANSRVQVLKNGVAVSGGQTKSHYIRNQNGHSESSAALVFALEGLVNGDIITVTTQQEGAAGTLDDSTAATLLIWKKQTFNQRPDAPIMYNAPFDNIRFASTTPYFDFSALDPDGTRDIEYEFSISTSSDFSASTTYRSASTTRFFNTASSTDTSPFVEGNKIRFQLTSGEPLTDLTTYYWRVRAKDVSGSGEFGDWSTTQSLTVDLAQVAPSWYQSYSGQFESDTLVGTVSSGNDKVQVDASVSSDIMLVYGEGTVTTPRYRIWNGTSWGTEGSAQAVNGTINWVATAAGVTRDEYVLGTVDATSRTYAQIYSASTSSWGNLVLLQSGITGPAYRGVAVGYESLSGDAMAISCSNGPNLVYRTWDGSSWSATSTIVVSSLNNCNYVQMASDPASDEIIVVTRDTGTQYQAFVWNGSAWVESRVIGSSAVVAREGIALAYEMSGDQAVIAVSNGINNNIAYTTWNGTEFSTNSTQATGNDFAFGKLVADTDSDELLLCYVDADADIGVLRWNGGIWDGAFQELETSGNSSTARPFDCAFETVAGRSEYEILTYSDATNVRYRAATSTSWSTEASVDTIEDSFWVRTERAGDGTLVAVTLDDAADILVTSRWNGTNWSTKSTLEATLSSTIAAPYEIYDMAAKRFQFSEGIVTTPPIDFTAVPNQPTWGDISFDTTEPFGTDVQVRVRHSSSTACDSYVPDVALPGNSGGFDVSEVPIDLTGLSTTTYDQICLEATVTTQGSQSGALDEWTLSWVRQPKLSQSNYRWYANGSFLTPTDPWPAGVVDLDENGPLTSVTAVGDTDTIRLRLAVEGVNVALPAFSEAFKLQYAEGLTCSSITSWSDVGGVSSTTALWRGYENSIVGDDWYSGSWQKRVKVTIDNAVVSGSITNFPVYIDLSMLPSAFFSGVQSDGDDIRVTAADGVTELPYELVRIDTGTESGELYFRAPSLATSSDTSFYVYYGNGSASGYAVTATYGRNNVWNNGFLAVYHLDQSPTATAPQFVDSTGNSQGTAQNMEAGDRLTGIIGRYQNLDGTNEYIDLGSSFNQSFLRSTWQIWASTTVNQAAYDGILFSRATGETTGINIASSIGRLGYHWRDAANTYSWTGGPTYATTSEPFMATLLVEPTQAVLWRHAGSGVASGTNAVTHATATIAALDIGQDPNGGRLFLGGIDEASISNVVRTEDWLSTTFNNRSNPSGFYIVSSEELINDGRLLPSTVLAGSDNPETYEEESPTRDNQTELAVNDESEWDFVLQNNGAEPDTNYCFRLVYEDGSQFNSYVNYPRLITNAPPLAPINSAPFDNERLASTSPWFEFAADDELGDDVAYQIQVSTDYNFNSTVIDNDSVANFALFTNLGQPSQKSTFTPGETIQFIPTTSLTNNTTYWWRVRAIDPDGSNTYGNWSTPTSFTVNTATVITTWFQTTGHQFLTDDLLDATSSVSSNDVGIESGFTLGTTTSTIIDFDDRDTGNAWGALSFTNNVTSGSIDYYVEYRVSGENFALVPDAVLPGNSSGFNSSPVSLVALDPDIYNELRLVAVLSGNATLPRLQDWTVTWSETIDDPTLDDPFDNAKVGTTTPSFLFFTSDPENNDLQYELQISSSYGFTSSSTFLSGVAAGFTNTEVATDTSPFFTDDVIRYTAQTPLINGNTYWWRVRARDPGGSNTWSNYSDPQSFTVDTSITTSIWYQTTGEQFDTGTLTDIETVAGGAQITSTIREVMTAYGVGTGQAPQYRLWNGTAWSVAASAQSVGAQLRWLELKASPSRPEYALATLGTDADVNVQIYDGGTETWGNVFSLHDNSVSNSKRTFNIAYESASGDLLAIACRGTDATYAIWNGTSWSATSTLNLSNTNNCEYIAVASDPTSDEIIAMFRHTNTGTTDYEAWVWNGSSWANNTQFGNLDGNVNEGMAVGYEESGGQAIVVASNNPNATSLYDVWNGTSWSGTSTVTMGDRLEWATMRPDVGTDRIAMCYQDNDADVGVIFWNGSGWDTFSELDIDGNADNGRAIDCSFETVGARDGYLMVGYSDTIGTRYQSYATSTPSGEVTLDTITDTSEITAIRSGDGTVMLSAYDDAQTPDRIDHSRWDGSVWTTRESFTTNASLDGVGVYNGGSSMAAQLYPNFTNGSIRSTPIDFADGTGPRWDYVSWNDTTPGASFIEYRVYYESAPGVFTLIPDSVLSGNAAGFTTSPIDLSNVNRITYSVLQLDAQLFCDSGDCPTIQDWTLAWSEGVTVSGIAREYDETSTTTSGTVAVAVNGVLQSGKTGTILGDGTWSIANVTVFPDDTVTVFVDGAIDTNEAVAIATYNGVGNMTGLELTKRHVTIGGASAATTTNANFAGYDNADDEDIFFTVGVGNLFTLCAEATCSDAILTIKTGTHYLPNANAILVTLKNYGAFSPATNTVRIAGIFNNQGTFNESASTVIFTATTSSTTLITATSSFRFYNVTFGETSGAATWSLGKAMTVLGNLAVNFGTLARGTSTLTLEGNLSIGASGNFSGLATTTFAGTGSHTWSDAKSTASSSNAGYVVIDGAAKTITLAGSVGAQSVTIGADDTLNASASGYNINVYSAWINNNSFVPQTGTVTFVGTSTGLIARGTSAFNNLTFAGAGGVWGFATSTLAVNGNFTIATGTVTLPTGTTTIAGSFSNTGGTFLHNNGEVRMTSTVAGRTITQSGTAFLNAFYDLVFSGSGSWSFSETNATTSRDLRIQSGSVTFPGGQLTVGGDLSVTGTGAFAHNNGEVVFIVQDTDVVRAGGSLLNNVQTVGVVESGYTRIFADTNVTVLGNIVLTAGGDAVFPTGTLSVGGSFTNSAEFNANNGTVRFNSTAGSETVTAGSSSFATLEFNSAGGIFTVAGHATATTAINLTNASSFTVSSGISLTSAGTFTNALASSSTTWTGSTLRLVRGAEVTLNAKTHGGDTYGTIEAASSTLVKMWNSSATSYTTTGTTSAIYSQDHAGIDGDLTIYGNYVRTSGTEHWSYATDFDGTALLGLGRQVDVRLASGATTTITAAALSILGTTSASTTIAAVSGSYNLVVSSSTLNAEYFTVSGVATSGMQLIASTTIGTFKDAAFTVTPGQTGITIDGGTINMNPAEQYVNFVFATTTAGAATNVTLSGTSTNYVWFRTGTGNLYGEAFDANDANPGAIRFDDSSYLINISGVVYSDDGTTPMGSPVCDGVTANVRIVVNGGSYTNAVACNAGTGAYTFTNVAYVGDPTVVVYLNTNGGRRGSVITKTPTTNITNMDIYADRVIVRHEDVAPLTITDMTVYDSSDDTDISFTALVGSPNTLVTSSSTELYIWPAKSFAPGGNVTLSGNGSSNSYEGTLALGAGSTFTAVGTETHTLAGRFVLGSGATFTPASSTVIFNATTTGKSITGTSTISFNNVNFAGTGGGWNITANLSVLGNMEVASGTVTGTSNITLENGSLTGNGVLSLGAGTTTVARSNTLGGTTPWTFYNLALGNGTVVGTTTPAGTATTTISGRLTIATAHFLDAGPSVWDLAGTGTVFVENGTFLEDTSTVRYSGASATVRGTDYYNLMLEAGVGSATYTAPATSFQVLGDLTVGGAAASLFTLNTNDPTVLVVGDVKIAANGTLTASNSATLSVRGDWQNDGTFTSSGGTVRFTGSGASDIAAGNSSFATIEIDGTGTFTVSEHATATVAWRLINHDLFTLASAQTMAVGGEFLNNLAGADTTFTGSTVMLYGTGTYEINDAATADTYEVLTVASGTHARMWNSSAATYTVANNGSLYSQDHAAVDGELYIYGNLLRTTGDDYWSYDTDFDGTDLSGGNERAAEVYFASGATALWTGGSLSVQGSSSASTTVQNQGSGTYGLTIGGTATTEWNHAVIRDISGSGITFTGTPTVTDFSFTDHLVSINSGSAITVAGTVIDINPAKNFTNNYFAESGGVTTPKNVTASGSTVSSWRFTNHSGNIDGEAFDDDPTGDPGYIVWDDSAALITVAGAVYSDEGTSVSAVCDGVTTNVRLVVAGLTTYDTTCNAGTGAYSIGGVAFSPLDTLTLYINGETEKAATVSVAPISSISNMHLYENRIIVRHESSNPLTIADMAVWDSSDDADIPFTATDAGSDTLVLPANYKLLVWTGKTFAPAGSVTVSGGGAGAAYDGTLEVQTNGTFRAAGTETHSVGGSVIFGTGASYTAASSTLTLTTTGAARTFDVNAGTLHNLSVTGSGSWSMTDATLTLTGSYTQSAGTVTLPTGTTTVAVAFNVTGGSVIGSTTPFLFTANGAGNAVRFNNSVVGNLTFNGAGSWSMNDTNATTTGSLILSRGTLTLPTGNLAIGRDFLNSGGSVTHNTADLIMTATSTATLTASSSTLYAVRFVGPAAFTLGDANLTLADAFAVSSGSVAIGTGTLSVAGSFTATGGTFSHASGTVLLNAGGAGRIVDPGTSSFYNLQIGAPAGGYTLYSATTTNNFTIASVNSLTVNPGATVRVYGVFLNSVGGAATTWTNTTLSLLGQSAYSINGRTNSGDVYGTLTLGPNTDVRMWYSSAATTTVDGSSSLYSQDHANINGDLYIYGDLVLATTTEYWNYATDFDGTALTGVERAVNVYLAPNATTTLTSGTLTVIGTSTNPTDITNQNGASTHALIISGGTLNADWYTMSRLSAPGLQLSGLSTITNLANGAYTLAVGGGSLITLSSTTLNANPSKIFDNVGFATTTAITGTNVTLIGETANAWRFTNSYGNLSGEAFDVDGVDACGSIRFDDSACLLTEQTHVRWRSDDGGEGAPDSEWFDLDWSYRTRVRILNNDNQSYASTAVKIAVTYDSGMQSNFADLRFTADDGVTPVPFWVERYTASTDAQVWVRVPTLPASDYATVFMYYGNGTASSSSSGTSTFVAFDDFEDNGITEYSGDTTLFTPVTSPVYGGTYALGPNPTSGKTTDGIFRFDSTVSQGQMIRYMQYVNAGAPGNNDEPCTLFGVQSPGTTNQNYAVCLERFGVDRMSLAENVQNNDTSGTVLASTTVTYSTGWYEVEIDWRTTNTIFVSLYNSAGTLVATTSATDSSYTSGGFGFAYWYQNGAWDSFTARARVATKPTIYFGTEQTAGGANWLSTLDSLGSAVPNTIVRLRLAIENSGLDITGQQFRLEYAAKAGAPTCESVATGNYSVVPNQASCGSSPVCMATSSNITNGAVTTDLLFGTNGTFSSGEIVTSPSNETSALDVTQDYYTELEYAVVPTLNASDSYCFRVTNAGSELDFYGTVGELGLQFDPSLGPVTLNDGLPISLTPGTTTAVVASSTVTDFNGAGDIAHATATIYRSGAGAACTPDNNNCYILTTENGGCNLSACAGNSCNLICEADVIFHADPTDAGDYEGQEWLAYVEVEDSGAAYDFGSALGVELITLRAITVDSVIDYGVLEANSDTGSYNASTTIINLGNVPINIDVEGSDLTDGGTSAIPAEQQKVSTSTFSYSACVACYQLSSSTPVTLSVNLTKPSVVNPPVETDVYWGIAVPFGTNSAPHSGMNIFTPISVP